MAEKIVLLCPHCGNTTSFSIAAEGSQPTVISIENQERTTWTTWRVLLCLTCLRPILERDVQKVNGPIGTRPARGATPEMLYPVTQPSLDHLPPVIRRMYEETLRIEKRSPRACLVMSNLTLEAVCEHEKVKGDSLAERLSHLGEIDRIPKPLAALTSQLPAFRQSEPHLAEEEITQEEVAEVLDFIGAVLEYLYIAPAKVQALRKRLNHNEEHHEASDSHSS